jgi:hypothetical protein
MKTCTMFAAVLLALTVGGCSGVGLTAPSHFAELGGSKGYVERLASADGVVIGVRREINDPRGDLAFWSDGLARHLRGRGYTEHASHELRTRRGAPGRRLELSVWRDGRRQSLWIDVYVTQSQVVLVEAAGDAERFAAREAELRTALASVEP